MIRIWKSSKAPLQAYNNFLAEASTKSHGRLRFAALVPIRNIEESVKELRRARGLGAVSVMLLVGWGCPAITDAFTSAEKFNRLQFAFLETGSQWVPYVIHQLRRGRRVSRDPAEYFREGRVYVACEVDEDINHVVSYIKEDSSVVASDYPHGDPSHEDNMEQAVMRREDLSLKLREKILSDNPQRLYRL